MTLFRLAPIDIRTDGMRGATVGRGLEAGLEDEIAFLRTEIYTQDVEPSVEDDRLYAVFSQNAEHHRPYAAFTSHPD